MQLIEDIYYAATSGEGFDKANAEEIATLHGYDPKYIYRLILKKREEIKKGDTE